MMLWLAITALLALAAAVALRRQRRRSISAALRARWGMPVDRERRLEAIAASHRSRSSVEPSHVALDDRTWNDLDLDAVFAALDRTESTLGQHALYHRLRTAPVGPHLDVFDKLLTRLGADAASRECAQTALARLQDPHGYDLWWLATPDAFEIRSWSLIFPVLSAATLLLIGLAPFWPQVIPAIIGAFALNVAVRYATDRHIQPMAAAFRQIAPVVAAGQALQFVDDLEVQPLTGALRADATSLGRLKTISRWISGDPLMLPVRPGSLALFVHDVISAGYEYLNLLLLLDANGVYFGAGEIRTRAPAFLRVMAAVGEVDAAISVASVRAGRREWTRPRFASPGTAAEWSNVCHPLIADAVPNSIGLAPGLGALVTGSNMSGKSTLLRTVGVNTILGQTLGTCFASKYEAPVFHVRSCIGRADDLMAGKSYYVVEVEALLGLVEASGSPSPHLFLLDELFRGTNAVERIAAGHAVLTELLVDRGGTKPHVVMAATHDGELVDLLSSLYAAWHFGDTVSDDGLTFDHRLRPGHATTRNAIALLKLRGAPESLVRLASDTATALDRERAAPRIG